MLDDLPPALAERLWSSAIKAKVPRGHRLVELGAHSTKVYVVLKGRAQAELISLGGRQVTLREMGEGAIFGDLAAIDQRPRSSSIVATTDCELAVIDGAQFRSAISEIPEGALWMAKRLATQVRELTERVFELNTLRVGNRLHSELLRMCEPIAGRRRITLEPSPTHANLASRIGSHREAVTRELTYLVGRGIVEQRNRRITVADVAALAHLVRSARSDLIIED